jgi:hypothetical protein
MLAYLHCFSLHQVHLQARVCPVMLGHAAATAVGLQLLLHQHAGFAANLHPQQLILHHLQSMPPSAPYCKLQRPPLQLSSLLNFALYTSTPPARCPESGTASSACSSTGTT